MFNDKSSVTLILLANIKRSNESKSVVVSKNESKVNISLIIFQAYSTDYKCFLLKEVALFSVLNWLWRKRQNCETWLF